MMRLRTVLVVVFTAAAAVVVSTQGVTVTVEPATVAAGQFATAVVHGPAGTSVTVNTDAPGVVPQTVVLNGGEQRVRLGPLTRNGDFRVTASAGTQQASTPLHVSFPQEQQPPAAGAAPSVHSYVNAATALIDAVDGLRTGVSHLPPGDPSIAETKAAIDDLQRQLADIRRAAGETDQTFDAVRNQMEKDATTGREAKDELTRLERELNQTLDEQSRQVREFGRDAAQPPADSCAAAMAVQAALQSQRSTMNAMRSGVRDLAAGQPRREAGASPQSAAEWRPIKAKIEDLVRTGQAGSYAEAERSIGRATSSNGLGGYTQRSCDKFTGEWSGTTNVEALHKTQPFYGLLNDWTAHVEIAAPVADPGHPDLERTLRGTLTGTASRFKVVNSLRVLYANMPAQSIEFLTVEPSAAQQEGATFVAALEGFIRGNQMTLKVRPGGVDYSGRVTGKMAAIVIPMASPIPLVQRFDVVFQGGNWQLNRALGPNGVTERPFAITVCGNKRMVQEHYPRSLSSQGARGEFTINIRLCAGCE